MAHESFDVIIVGARCAGATTALALARRGLRVLVCDRARFPSDTLSTHNFSRETAARFRDLGLLDAVIATGAPPIRGMRLVAPDDGVAFAGRYAPVDGLDAGYCVRRILLDEIIVRAAREAGAEVREATPITGLLWEDERVVGVEARSNDGTKQSLRAKVVVGADGRHSQVARWVGATFTRYDPPLTPAYYGYFHEVRGPRDRGEYFRGQRRDYLLLPTDSELTCTLIAHTQPEFAAYRANHRTNFLADLNAIPELAERFASAELVGPLQGAGDLDNYLRRAHGPGWALVGDAGAHMHPVNAVGIGLATRDALRLADALVAGLGGAQSLDAALAAYETARDEALAPVYAASLAAAQQTGTPVPAAQLAFWRALARLPDDADRMINGQVRSAEDRAAILERARALDVAEGWAASPAR